MSATSQAQASMNIAQVQRLLEVPAAADAWLQSSGVQDVRRGRAVLGELASSGIPIDLLAVLCGGLAELLPRLSDADMALINLGRFIQNNRSPLSLASLFERDHEALPTLLQLLSGSQYLADVLITDVESYDLLRLTEGQPVARDVLVGEVAAETTALADESAAMRTLRRYKQRETLRIAYGDLIRGQRLEIVTGQISYLADALLEGALRYAQARLEEKRGVPRRPDGQRARYVILGMGKLGGAELNYSSDIDLILLYECDGQTDGQRRSTNAEFFDRLSRDLVRLMTEPTELGVAWRVDLRLRPEGERGPIARSVESAQQYYDVLGRTWERQAFVKARPVAGDLELGQAFLSRLSTWVYRKYLSQADIAGIRALKRRIEQRAEREGHDLRDVKTGRGGIRDVEFVLQFLQLLNGGDLPALRVQNTLHALAQLEQVGCLTHQERQFLEENYSFLRKIEHSLQLLYGLQTHLLPSAQEELQKLAVRLGYRRTDERSAAAAFEADLQTKTQLNRRILDHLLHDAFSGDSETEPEVDLVLDPDPSPARIAEVLGRYAFRDVPQAYQNLMALSTERIRFLSTRRCRHFLAAIAPRLIKAIAATPDPDFTLVNLAQVSDSLGGKGVLWELFSFNPPSMQLYVEVCSSSAFLSGILMSNPGMLDELMDSLVLNKLPTFHDMRQTLQELVRGAEDIDPILHSFKNAQVLRVGARDLLGKEQVQATDAALSEIAECLLEQVVWHEYARLTAKWGEPTVGEGPRAGEPAELVILGLGKLGGKELSYHSDLDLVFLYDHDGATAHRPRSRRGDTTTNQHFFSELAQRIIKTIGRLGPQGRLYEVDARLRPTGKSGALACPFNEFARYFASGDGQLWERQALCKARVVFGAPAAASEADQLVEHACYGQAFQPHDAQAIREMRARVQAAGSAHDLKRGPGGMADVEFLVQMLQLRHGAEHPTLRVPNTLAALTALHRAGLLSADDFQYFHASYEFLRRLKSRLRVMHVSVRDDLPEQSTELAKLARGLSFSDNAALAARCAELTAGNRARFERIFQACS